METLLEACAHELMDTAPKIFQAIRAEMRRRRGADISIPQFRSLGFVQRNPDSSLSDLASHLGLTLPSVSKLVDGLVKQGLISRRDAVSDRRCLKLELTQRGKSIVNSAQTSAQANLAKILSGLSSDELTTVHQALELLYPLFVPQGRQPLSKD
jgi:DNA-binding MarR family transcriptional regulator